MKRLILLLSAIALTSCATRSSFVPTKQTGEWSIHRHKPDRIIDPLILDVGVPQERLIEWFNSMGVSNLNPRTTKAFTVTSDDGREISIFLLDGGKKYEVEITKDGKGFSHSFDENGKCEDSRTLTHGYKKTQNQALESTSQ